MSSRKSKKTDLEPKTNGHKLPRSNGANIALVLSDDIGGLDTSRPYLLNPESSEERQKRLAKRKALTLRAFQKAYENHRARKVS